MTVSLLQCAPPVVSLEFDPEDKEAVKAALTELFGEIQVTAHIVVSTLRIAGEDFTFQNEWGDPCLITGTARGAEMLRAVAERLGAV